MEKQRIPLRMCLGCSEMKPKKELVRIVKASDGRISLDPVGKSPGRGAYICKSVECLKKARKAKRLERTFKSQVAQELWEQLEKELNELEQ